MTAPAGSDELHVCNVTTRATPKIAAKTHSAIDALNSTADRSKQKPTKSFSSDPQEGKRNKRSTKSERTNGKQKTKWHPFFKTTLPVITLYIHDLNMPIKIQRLSE